MNPSEKFKMQAAIGIVLNWLKYDHRLGHMVPRSPRTFTSGVFTVSRGLMEAALERAYLHGLAAGQKKSDAA